MGSPALATTPSCVMSVRRDSGGNGLWCPSFFCSPLSCNGMAEESPVNRYCLVDGLDTAIPMARDFATGNYCEPGVVLRGRGLATGAVARRTAGLRAVQPVPGVVSLAAIAARQVLLDPLCGSCATDGQILAWRGGVRDRTPRAERTPSCRGSPARPVARACPHLRRPGRRSGGGCRESPERASRRGRLRLPCPLSAERAGTVRGLACR